MAFRFWSLQRSLSLSLSLISLCYILENPILILMSFFVLVVQCTGDYEYIDVMVRDSNGDKEPTRLIVDTDFKSQFEVARPTPTYKELINTLPSVFVGSEEKLNQIISLLCSAAKKSLKERGLHVPPWRKANYMRSKWLSKECKKVSLSTNMDLGMVSKEWSNSTVCSSNFKALEKDPIGSFFSFVRLPLFACLLTWESINGVNRWSFCPFCEFWDNFVEEDLRFYSLSLFCFLFLSFSWL